VIDTRHQILLYGLRTLNAAENVALNTYLVYRRAVGKIISDLEIILIAISSYTNVLWISIV